DNKSGCVDNNNSGGTNNGGGDFKRQEIDDIDETGLPRAWSSWVRRLTLRLGHSPDKKALRKVKRLTKRLNKARLVKESPPVKKSLFSRSSSVKKMKPSRVLPLPSSSSESATSCSPQTRKGR
ncbi:hypothetical protein OTU49_011415, partial [Cherax quadricarinatus]